jgi:Uma2 family endonuclease
MSTAIELELDEGVSFLPVVLHFQSIFPMSDDQLFEFAQINSEWRIERDKIGDLSILPLAGFDAGHQNSELTMQLGIWAKANGQGKAFDSSTGFRRPNGATRSPDAAWIKNSRIKKLTAKERKKFAPICPDFVAELRSETDRLKTLKSKMEEYIENGAHLGLLIDPLQRRVYIYRRDGTVEMLEDPATVLCDPVLHGFTLVLRDIWSE